MLPYISMPVTQNSMPVASFIVVQIDTGLVYVSEYGVIIMSQSQKEEKICRI